MFTRGDGRTRDSSVVWRREGASEGRARGVATEPAGTVEANDCTTTVDGRRELQGRGARPHRHGLGLVDDIVLSGDVQGSDGVGAGQDEIDCRGPLIGGARVIEGLSIDLGGLDEDERTTPSQSRRRSPRLARPPDSEKGPPTLVFMNTIYSFRVGLSAFDAR